MIEASKIRRSVADLSSVWHLLFVWLLATVISLALFLPAYIIPLNGCMLISPEGDGLKSYFATIWQTVHGQGIWFFGMAYPYGDHITFPDGQPLLVIVLKFIDKHIMRLGASHIVGAIILLILQGIVLAQVCVYYLLRRASVSFGFAFVGAFLVAYQAPQIDRVLAGHLSLSYVFFIPLLWLLLDKSLQSAKAWGMLVLATLLITASAFVHMYYLPMLVLFAWCFYAVTFIQRSKYNSKTVLAYVHAMVLISFPLVAVKLWLSATDGITDRVAIPSGLESYRASWFSIFLPQQMAPANAYYQFEGIAYVGLAGLPLLGWVAWRILTRLIKKQGIKAMLKPVRSKVLSSAFWMGIPFLLLAKGSIVLWLLGKWPDVFEFLRQFRSLGRFAWVFYFTMSVLVVYVVYLMYRFVRLRSNKLVAATFVFLLMTPSVFTTFQFVKPLRQAVASVSQRNCPTRTWQQQGYGMQQMLNEGGMSADSFQAILPMPYYNLGSEKYFIGRTNKSRYMSFASSIETGLPVMGQYMARSSIGLTAKQVQLLGHDLLKKELLTDLPDDRSILVTYTGEELNKAERALLSKCELISESNNGTDIYKLYPGNLRDAWVQAQTEAAVLLVDTAESCVAVWETYSDNSNVGGKDGAGAWKASSTDYILWQGIVPTTDTSNISFWLEIDTIYHSFPQIYLATGDEEQHIDPQNFYDTQNGWLRVETDVVIPTGQELTLRVVSQGELSRIDNLLIYKKACGNVITTGSSGIRYLNNFPLEDVTQ